MTWRCFGFIAPFLLLMTTGLLAQNDPQHFIDTASAALPNAPDDSNKVKLLIDLAYESRYGSPAQSLEYANRAIDLSQQLGWQKGEADACHFSGAMLLRGGQRDSSLVMTNRAVELYRSIDNAKGMSKAMSEVAKAHAMAADFAEATDWYKQALEEAIRSNDTGSMSFSYSNLASVHAMVSNLPEALENFQKGLELAERSGDRQGTLLPLANIAQVHSQMGDMARTKAYYLRALEVAKEFKMIQYQASILANLIDTYSKDNDFNAAHQAFEEGMALARQMRDPRLIASFYNALQHLQKKEGDYAGSLNSLDSVLVLAESIGNTRLLLQGHMNRGSLLNLMAAESKDQSSSAIASTLREAARSFYAAKAIVDEKGHQKEQLHLYTGLKDLYVQLGKLDSVTKYYDLHAITKDTIAAREKAKEIAELEAVREVTLKEKEVELLVQRQATQEAEQARERAIWFGLIGGIVLLIVGLIWFGRSQIRLSQLKLANQELERERLQVELDAKKKDLTDFALDNSKKREWTQQVMDRLLEIRKAGPEERVRIIQSMTVELKSQWAADEEIQLFQKNVDQVNAEFYTNLLGRFPNLTKTEKNLCGLIRLNMSGKEIANLRNVDPATITKSKQRLRKKLDLDPSVDLHAFMREI